tara:strand:+ start:2255 stop:3832 length:1578 start_codon:yes stop_codon:yes gene_type:complete
VKKYLLSTIIFISTYCFGQDSPNFLWLVCEDQSLFFSIYGDSSANTPNINQLAEDGVIYQNCYTPSPVCGPSRSSLITGMYPTTLGTHHMRAYKNSTEKTINPHNSLPYYSANPKKPIRFFTEDLRAKGYYCTNNSKEDYNMKTSPLAWDESSETAHWRKRQEGQSFFSIFNFNVTHESRVWRNINSYSEDELENIKTPNLFPNNDEIKSDILTNYKNIEKLDKQIGVIINQLKEDSLYENTIIFFFSDHGGPFPRYKRSIYETGIHVPMVVKWIDDTSRGKNYQFISFIDFAPTILDIVNIEREFPFEGISFFQKNDRNFIYAATDRFDEKNDRRRSIREKKFKLIYNVDTSTPIYKSVNYREKMRTMQILDSLNEIKKITPYFYNWFSVNKSRFELYNVNDDYYELNNLINDPKYEKIFKSLKYHLFKWIEESDFGNVSESEMLNSMFGKSMSVPVLKTPEIISKDLGYIIKPNNINTSVGWRNKNETIWKIYRSRELIKPKDDFEVILFQPGYEILIKHFKK